MAPNNFVFPPPPPPPPQTSYQSFPTYPANQSRNNPNHRHQYGAYRGRGQANGFRGSSFPRGNISQRQSFGFHRSEQQSSRGIHASQASQSSTPGHFQKQTPYDAFSGGPKHDRSTAPRAPAAPAVPRFGLPLPSKTAALPEPPAPLKKRKREHNQLGLTPKQEEHESSEEDVDEEERLARSMGITGKGQLGLQFTYNGRSSTLKTLSELAAWLAERRKRYPTRARIEEEKARKARQREEARLAIAAKQEQERKKEEEQSLQLVKPKGEESVQKRKKEQREKDHKGDGSSREEKAVQKAEKLRIKYERAQQKVARLTAQISNPKVKMEEDQKPAPTMLSETTVEDLAVARLAAAGCDAEVLLTPTSQSHSPIPAMGAEVSDPARGQDALEPAVETQDYEVVTVTSTLALSDSNSLDSSDTTSSDSDSDSDDTSQLSSDIEDDSSDSDAAPTEQSSKVPSSHPIDSPTPPPPKQMKNELCRSYVRNGRCPLDGQCKYKHELPKRGAQQKVEQKQQSKRQKDAYAKPVAPRLTLYQRMVLQEKEQEDEAILDHIIYLGEKGLLEEKELNDQP